MKRLLAEPLVHFILLGAVIFATYSAMHQADDTPGERRIVVAASKIEHLATLFQRTWQRPPTPAELDGLIADFVREEAAYREGVALGLDVDDAIIRRRIRQKLDFVAEEFAVQTEPTDAELRDYLEAHAEDFVLDPILSFHQVYFSPQRRGASVEGDARTARAELEADPSLDPGAMGDVTLLELAYKRVTAAEVAGLFGPEFAAAAAQLEPGAWRGPIPSTYGLHVVRVDERTPGRVPALDEVRASVMREWENDRRKRSIEAYYKRLVAKYDVVVEWPDAPSEGGAP